MLREGHFRVPALSQTACLVTLTRNRMLERAVAGSDLSNSLENKAPKLCANLFCDNSGKLTSLE